MKRLLAKSETTPPATVSRNVNTDKRKPKKKKILTNKSHFSDGKDVFCGYLIKKGKLNTLSFRRRWFVAKRGSSIQYFKVSTFSFKK